MCLVFLVPVVALGVADANIILETFQNYYCPLNFRVQQKNGSPDKPRGLSIQPCKSEKEEPYIRHSSQGRSECLYLRIE